jgi:hypothetical protein
LFSFGAVRPDFYDLAVEAAGFNRYVSKNVKIDPNVENSLAAIKLDVQQIQQSVEVSATATTVQTTNNEVTATLTQSQVRNLPVLDRQVSNLFRTQAGVTQGRGTTVINGLRSTYANVTLDGINVQDNYIRSNGLDYIPSRFTIEQVAEFSVASSNVSAASPGAVQVTQITQSGSNQFHGAAYWYNRNSYFAANDFFRNQRGITKPQLNQNQFGGSFSGPAIKDKLLFFGNYEGLRLNTQALRNRQILTPEARQGLFRYRSGGEIRTANIYQLRSFTQDPVMQDLINQLPTVGNNPTIGDGLNTTGYSFNQRGNTTREAVTGKLDYYLNPKHNISSTFLWNTDTIDRGDVSATTFTATPAVQNQVKNTLWSANWRWTPFGTFTNEVRGGFLRAEAPFNTLTEFPPYLVGAATGVTLPFSNPVNTFQPQGRFTNTYSLQDNANWTKGRHNMSFGWQVQWIRVNAWDQTNVVPTYTLGFNAANNTALTANELPGSSANDLQNANNLYLALAGIINGYNVTFNVKDRTSGYVLGQQNSRNYTNDNHSLYFQDQWKLHRRLSLTLGVRWEYYTPYDDAQGLQLLPVVPQGSNFISTLLSNHTLDFAGSGTGRRLYNPDYNNFGPRVGFAWDVFGNGKTAIRGGYAITYPNEEMLGVFSTLADNFGLSSNVQENRLSARVATPPTIPTPAFKVPRQLSENPANGVGATIDPGLVSPYIQQFSLGVQQEFKGWVLEARYVGNKGTKLWRTIDYNQIDVRRGGFLDDFIRARNNAFAAQNAGLGFNPNYNPNVSGSQPLTVFPTMPSGGFLSNGTVQGYLQRGEPGSLAQFYQNNGVNGPINFFPNALALRMRGLTNYSNSTYHSLQLEGRRRLTRDFQIQANYTYSKALSDSLGNTSDRFEEFLDYNNAKIEKAPAPFDLRHVFKANGFYELPFGKGKTVDLGRMNSILGGWVVSSNLTVQSGSPFSILSARGTLNRDARSGQNTASTVATGADLDRVVGFRMTGNGPYFIDPSALYTDGRGVAPDGRTFAGQVFYNPNPGTIGTLQRRMFNGPMFWNVDASVLKTFRFFERQSIEFRAEAFNLVNHAQFFVGDSNINSTTFGQITQYQQNPVSRVLQFGLYYRF